MDSRGSHIPRVLEPEIMDTEEEAADYDAMDHGRVNASFIDDLLAPRPVLRVLDVGTGTAQIPLEPAALFREMVRLVGKRGLLFVRDLARPESEELLRAPVDAQAPVPERLGSVAQARAGRQRALFEASLRAALTVAEVCALVKPLGVPDSAVTMTSDRHWTLAHGGST